MAEPAPSVFSFTGIERLFRRVPPEETAETGALLDVFSRGGRFLPLGVRRQEPSPVTKSDKIETAMRQYRVLRVEYTRRWPGEHGEPAGDTAERFLKPYEVKPHPMSGRPVLYAQDTARGPGIRAFLWSRLGGTMLTDNRFDPTWPTRPETVD